MALMVGYARVSTDGQTRDARLAQLEAAGAGKVFQERPSGAKRDRPQLQRLLASLSPGDVVLVTRLDRLARSTRDLLNVMAAVAEKGAAFRSLGDSWADITTARSRPMLTVLAGLAEFERELIRSRIARDGRGPKPLVRRWADPTSSRRTRDRRRATGARRARRW